MLYFLATAVVLVTGLLAMARHEYVHGVRLGGNARRRLDRTIHRLLKAMHRGLLATIEFLHKDLFIKLLHMVSYTALICVRFMERRLEQLTKFFRSFHSRKASRTAKEEGQRGEEEE